MASFRLQLSPSFVIPRGATVRLTSVAMLRDWHEEAASPSLERGGNPREEWAASFRPKRARHSRVARIA